jgi:hypothetical protein
MYIAASLHARGCMQNLSRETVNYSVQAEAGVKVGVAVTGVKTGKEVFRIAGKNDKILYEYSGDARMMRMALVFMAAASWLAPR